MHYCQVISPAHHAHPFTKKTSYICNECVRSTVNAGLGNRGETGVDRKGQLRLTPPFMAAWRTVAEYDFCTEAHVQVTDQVAYRSGRRKHRNSSVARMYAKRTDDCVCECRGSHYRPLDSLQVHRASEASTKDTVSMLQEVSCRYTNHGQT